MADETTDGAVEDVEVRGHIIDSLILPKILDLIVQAGGSFKIKDIAIGQGREDASLALLEVRAESRDKLDAILAQINDHGAVRTTQEDVRLVTSNMDAAFPEGFYSTTNQKTQVRLDGEWVDVDEQEMDCGLVVDPKAKTARCIPMLDVRESMEIVVGHAGVRVFPYERSEEKQTFEFMNSAVSTEKPKGVAVRQIAQQMFDTKKAGGRTAIVGGPAIVHTGSIKHMSALIERGYVNLLLAGNALATHDIERSMFGTSLGVDLDHGNPVEAGHEHHLRAVNRVRRVGSIKKAVDEGVIKSGIMYECVKHEVPFLLAGSIRDDGPLPDVVTDCVDAQVRMREMCRGLDFCLMIATTLHSIAVGNLLPAWVKVVCVDINPSTVIKLSDRGSFQTVGLVTDVEPFLRNLEAELKTLEEAT